VTEYCDREENNLEILRDLQDFSTPECKRMSGMPPLCLSVCLSRCMPAQLAPERLDGFCSYSVFNNLSIICLSLVNTNILAFPRSSRTQNCGFMEKGSKEFNKISIISEKSPQIKPHTWYLYRNNGTPPSGPHVKCQMFY
jgi:hypothetical protein